MAVGEGKLALHVLASGSKGNCSLIEHDGRFIMVDCGICRRDFIDRCTQLGIDTGGIEAVLVTHEHTDHTKGLGVVMRELKKRGTSPMVITSEAIRAASKPLAELQDTCDLRAMKNEDVFSLAGTHVYAFHTSHDASESFGFRFQTDADSIGFMTDTGIVTPQAHELLQDVRILALESNHDLAMLHNGDYPYSLKVRVESEFGHLSNDQCATELESLLSNTLQQVVAMHISENNNTFGLPVRTLEQITQRNGHGAPITAGLPRTPQSFR